MDPSAQTARRLAFLKDVRDLDALSCRGVVCKARTKGGVICCETPQSKLWACVTAVGHNGY
jgi:hypothetical protein